MSIEIDALVEVYQAVKEYVPAKDRQEAADNVMGVMVDMLNDHDLKEFSTTDKFLSKAYVEYVVEDDEPDEEIED